MRLTRILYFIFAGGLLIATQNSAQSATLTLQFIDDAGKPINNVVAALIPENKPNYAEKSKAVMDQQHKMFVPGVLAVRVNTLVQFPNSDNIRHQVYSFSPAKRFELRLYHGMTAQPVLFDQAGQVVLGCNIHDSMVGYIYVVDSEYFSVSDGSGMANINTIPAGKYNIDSMHSKVGFEVPHLVISSVEGKFNQFEGTINVDSKIEKSKVELNVDTASVDTGVTKRDDHLKSPDFFDSKKFPKMTFTSTKISQNEDEITLTGTLKIKDKSKEVTIVAKYLGEVKDGYGQQKIAFKGKTKINRKEFGLTWSQAVEAGPIVGDDIEILRAVET